MAKKIISWRTKGMNKDSSVSIFNPEFAFDNLNLRLVTNDNNTLMSWVTEKGTSEMKLHIDVLPFLSQSTPTHSKYVEDLEGIVLGTATINHILVLFTHNEASVKPDHIYKLWKSKDTNYDLEGVLLYKGNLNFNLKYPIETLVSYESELIQKVYWTDNLNQPRFINIASTKYKKNTEPQAYNDTSFDFVQDVGTLNIDVKVTKKFGIGEFPPGVIQYAFSYYNKNGQESNIFYVTPLYYISYLDRGGSPEGKIANAFSIYSNRINQSFDYIRIYSILRTSIEATPRVKRIQDISTKRGIIEFVDDGLQGNTVDPSELLYKGGEVITAKTIEQKDNTLFLGNITTQSLPLDIQENLTYHGALDATNNTNTIITPTLKNRPFTKVSTGAFSYINTLSSPSWHIESKDSNNNTTILDSRDTPYEGASGFKAREYYRLGIQFQYKTGKWSEPYFIGDFQQTQSPSEGTIENSTLASKVSNLAILNIPEFKLELNSQDVIKEGKITKESLFKTLYKLGYRCIRPVFVVPNIADRTILCQGIACPTLYRDIDRTGGKGKSGYMGTLYAQSSWLFRCPTSLKAKANALVPNPGVNDLDGHTFTEGGKVSFEGKLKSQFEEQTSGEVVSPWITDTEVMGNYDEDHSFKIDPYCITLNSPDLVFDTSFHHIDFNDCKVSAVGEASLFQTFGDIDIQVSTPPIGTDVTGFIHKSVNTEPSAALISGNYFNDNIVKDEAEEKYKPVITKGSVGFPIYMWHKNGSLNNDVNRINNSANLLKKKISNYRLSNITKYNHSYNFKTLDIQLFDSNEPMLIKVAGHPYMGCIDTMVTPTSASPYFLMGNIKAEPKPNDIPKEEYSYYMVRPEKFENLDSKGQLFYYDTTTKKWVINGDYTIGTNVRGVSRCKEGVSIKYKATPHLVLLLDDNSKSNNLFKLGQDTNQISDALPILEITREYNKDTFYGGTSKEALQDATWIPCGPKVEFFDFTNTIELYYKWGDTFFQRFECLKTYPYTHEDKNQVVEIASFMCESRINMDGRYDRNRGQISNLNMSPINFNLMNPIYSQMDDFFSYKILDEDSHKNTKFPNNITWTLTKQNGADVDAWTTITTANTLELDGDKGSLNKLIRFNNQLLAFQDTGISQILYNENTQISTSEGVPIEIANSNKVQGKRYYSDTIGCSNKWSIVNTPLGIYFIDNITKSIYLFNGQLANLSTSGGFNSWAKTNILSSNFEWNPEEFKTFVSYYDKQNQDILFINNTEALAYSEKLGCFTSFYNYEDTPYLVNLDDISIWYRDGKLWKHQGGDYCKFFNHNKPFAMTLIGNQEPNTDKIFTNLEFRACVDGEGTYNEVTKLYTPILPLDTIEVWNEYQHGIYSLRQKDSKEIFNHSHNSNVTFLNRKFRMWRCEIPRNNAPITEEDSKLGIKRFKPNPLDRIRNPWVYLKLSKKALVDTMQQQRIEFHDIMGIYFT